MLYVEGGETAVIDAVYVTAQRISQTKREAGDRRRAMILITDGEDRDSYYKKERLIELLRKENVQIFVKGTLLEYMNNLGVVTMGF